MFHWLTKIILSIAVFLGISSPAVLPTLITDLTPTPTAVVSTLPTATPTPTVTSTTPPSLSDRKDIIALKTFQAAPSINSLRSLCGQARTIETNLFYYKDELSKDRSGVMKVISLLPLSTFLTYCRGIDSKDVQFYSFADAVSLLSATLLANDSDALRLEKIKYNADIISKMKNYGVIGISFCAPYNLKFYPGGPFKELVIDTNSDFRIELVFPEAQVNLVLKNSLFLSNQNEEYKKVDNLGDTSWTQTSISIPASMNPSTWYHGAMPYCSNQSSPPEAGGAPATDFRILVPPVK